MPFCTSDNSIADKSVVPPLPPLSRAHITLDRIYLSNHPHVIVETLTNLMSSGLLIREELMDSRPLLDDDEDVGERDRSDSSAPPAFLGEVGDIERDKLLASFFRSAV